MKIETRKTKGGMRYRSRFMLNYTSFKSPWKGAAKEARDWAAAKRLEVLSGLANTGSDISVFQFGELFLQKHAFANKVYSAALRDKHALKLFTAALGTKKLRDVTTADIEFFFSDLKRDGKLSPKTIKNYLGTVKTMFRKAVRWGYLRENPAKDIEPPRIQENEVTTFRREEITRLLAFAHRECPNEYELILFALNTGCRVGECVALEWAKVDFEEAIARIDSHYDGQEKKVVPRTKGKRSRRVPLNGDILALLRRMKMEGRPQESRYVFGRVNYDYLIHEKFRRILGKAQLNGALERKATFHCLRHTFASEFMRAGGNLYVLQHILGHTTIKQTERYARFAPDQLKGETQRVSFSLPEGKVIELAAVGMA